LTLSQTTDLYRQPITHINMEITSNQLTNTSM